MPKSRNIPIIKSDDPGQDLRNALARLMRGQPLHPELKKAKSDGRLRINILTVAKEANRSRTLIGKEDCAYPDIRKDVRAIMDADAEAGAKAEKSKSETKEPTAQEIISSLRDEIRLLRQEKAILATRMQDAILVARKLEKEREQAKRKAKRTGPKRSHAEQVVGLKGNETNVIPFADLGDK